MLLFLLLKFENVTISNPHAVDKKQVRKECITTSKRYFCERTFRKRNEIYACDFKEYGIDFA
jgi:hypothetical protein